MNWNNGYKVEYRATIVDTMSWLDTKTFDMTGGNISRVTTGLRESARLEQVTIDPDSEIWIRVYMYSRQGGHQMRTALFTGIATTPSWEIDGRRKDVPLDCYSVLKPCEDVKLKRGWTAPRGGDGAEIVRQLLSETTPAPVFVDGISPKLSQNIIALDGESHLSMADRVLTAINWRLRIAGDGTITICPNPTTASVRFDAIENDSIEPKLSLSNDWYKCPNVFRAIQGDIYAEARDDSDSKFSTKTRGREVWEEESSCNLNDGESIDRYAARRLKELQQSIFEVRYTRRYNPDLLASDLVALNYPEQKITGLYRVVDQSIDMTYGGQTSEVVEAV